METGFKGNKWRSSQNKFEENAEGFQVTFDNGVTVSVQFGEGHYCSQRCKRTPGECATAEVAIFAEGGRWLTNKWRRGLGDAVAGWQSPHDVTNALKWAERQ